MIFIHRDINIAQQHRNITTVLDDFLKRNWLKILEKTGSHSLRLPGAKAKVKLALVHCATVMVNSKVIPKSKLNC